MSITAMDAAAGPAATVAAGCATTEESTDTLKERCQW